jgi:uncharacterized protein YkwD
MLSHRRTIVFAFVVLLVGPGSLDAKVADDPDRPKSSVKQRREIRGLVSEYRRAKKDLNRKEAVLQQALVIGSAAVEPLLAAVEKELKTPLDRYRKSLYNVAQTVAQDRNQEVDMSEVIGLRNQVNSLREMKDLAKAMIVQKGDPAMDRLRQLLIVNRDQILAASEELVLERQELGRIGAIWEACKKSLAAEDDVENATSFEELIVQEEKLAAQSMLPISNVARQVLTVNFRLAEQLDANEAECVAELNLTRILLGLEPCLIDLKLAVAARGHSEDMMKLKFFAHESPVAGKKTPLDRAKLAGTTSSAENIATGARSGEGANRMWFHSPGHHKNMLGSHKRVGLGKAGKYYTELFGN